MDKIIGGLSRGGEITGHLSGDHVITGSVNEGGTIAGELAGGGEIVGHLSGNRVINGSINVSSIKPYNGDYEATPSWSEQVYPTRGYRMVDDFTVNGIVKQEVSNSAGGLTLSI